MFEESCRLGTTLKNSSKSEPEPPGQKHTSIAEEPNCKRCGAEMLLATVLTSHGRNLFRCLVCDFYEVLKT